VQEHERRIWHLVAFLGRYGHQPADVCLAMTMTDLQAMGTEVNAIMRAEQAATIQGLES